MQRNGVTIMTGARAERILTGGGKVEGVCINGHNYACKAVISNGSLPRTVLEWTDRDLFTPEYLAGFNEALYTRMYNAFRMAFT